MFPADAYRTLGGFACVVWSVWYVEGQRQQANTTTASCHQAIATERRSISLPGLKPAFGESCPARLTFRCFSACSFSGLFLLREVAPVLGERFAVIFALDA